MTVADLSPVIAATTRWLARAYPGLGGALGVPLVHAQARQAVTVAAWLRYPTATDAALLVWVGPGGSARLDRLVGYDLADGPDLAWRSWVDEVVASWATCLLSAPALAGDAVAAVASCEHAAGLTFDFQRLTSPDERDRSAAELLRHPDLVAPVAGLHRAALVDRLAEGWINAA